MGGEAGDLPMAVPKWYTDLNEPAGPVVDAVVPPSDPPSDPPPPESTDAVGTPPEIVAAYIRSTGRPHDNALWLSKVNDKPKYVIIGRGFAGTLNLATMLRTPHGLALLRQHQVVIYGGLDPWNYYRRHEMNQEREVLTLPGFESQLPEQEIDVNYCKLLHEGFPSRGVPYVISSDFGLATQKECRALRHEAEAKGVDVRIEREVVESITRDEAKNKFVVNLRGGKTLLAQYVDICAGPGQSRVLGASGDRGLEMPQSLRREYEEPPMDSSAHYAPRIVAASEYTRENVDTPPGAIVLVQGAGPAAGQGVEEAFRMGAKEVLWVAGSGVHHSAFIPNKRIDFLVVGRKKSDASGAWTPLSDEFHGLPAKATAPDLAVNDVFDIRPRIPGLWLIPNCRAKKVALTQSHKRMIIDFASTTKPPAARLVAVGIDGETREFTRGVFDQVVIAQGREQDIDTPGCPVHLVKPLDLNKFKPITYGEVLSGGERVGLGMQLIEGDPVRRVRILGSAGLSGQGPKSAEYWMKSKHSPSFTGLEDYQDTLPSQSRVFFQGVTLSAATIAYANGYFDGTAIRPNVNRNTSTNNELRALEPDTASETLRARRTNMRPFLVDAGASKAMYDPDSKYPHREEKAAWIE